MKSVYIYLADGFEEIEALSPADVLRRAGVNVTLVAVKDELTVTGARGVNVVCDALLEEVDITLPDMIILPGGYPGFENLANSPKVMQSVEFMSKHERIIGAICGAPAAVLGKNGYLENRRAVCYPGMEDDLNCKRVHNGHVCADQNIITAKAASSALDFSFVLLQNLCGVSKANEVKRAIVYDV